MFFSPLPFRRGRFCNFLRRTDIAHFCLLYEGANCCRGYKNLLQSVHIRGIIVKANLVLDLQKQDFANSNSAPKLLWPLLCYSYGSVFVFFTTNKLYG